MGALCWWPLAGIALVLWTVREVERLGGQAYRQNGWRSWWPRPTALRRVRSAPLCRATTPTPTRGGSALLTSTFKLERGRGPGSTSILSGEHLSRLWLPVHLRFRLRPGSRSIRRSRGRWHAGPGLRQGVAEYTSTMAHFVISLPSGESHGLRRPPARRP